MDAARQGCVCIVSQTQEPRNQKIAATLRGAAARTGKEDKD
jgi:hypothetical protein